MQRTCDDCFKQIEIQKSQEHQQKEEVETLLAMSLRRGTVPAINRNFSAATLGTVDGQSVHSGTVDPMTTGGVAYVDEIFTSWQLIGQVNSEVGQRHDDLIRDSFRYQQAPSTSLCLSILDLHDEALECGRDLLSMCDDLSNYLQAAHYQVEDFALIINMIKLLLHNAKVCESK